jgi:glutaryl-CoA dehydrogenase
MGELGLLGPTIPEAYGGAGLNYVCYGLVAREVERVDSGYRSMMSVQSSLVMVPIFEFGNEQTKQKYLPKLATGEWIGCFGLTEPNHGSDPQQHDHPRQEGAGRLQPVGQQDVDHQQPDRRRVRGLGQGRRRRDPRLRAGKGLEGPVGPGHPRQGGPARLHHRRDRDGRGLLPDENAFPEVRGLKGPFTCLNSARYGIAWGALGAAEFCWHMARQYTLDRKQFGRRWPPTSWCRRSWPT